jgi:transcriptional regulator with XRE-family HTH domain
MFSIHGELEAMKKLGERIKAQRLHRNLSQDYVAQVLGVTRPTYRKIETGDGSVEFRHIAKVIGFFERSEALGELVPEPEPVVRLENLLRPERQRAGKARVKA